MRNAYNDTMKQRFWRLDQVYNKNNIVGGGGGEGEGRERETRLIPFVDILLYFYGPEVGTKGLNSRALGSFF
jgi:hypothetical protein